MRKGLTETLEFIEKAHAPVIVKTLVTLAEDTIKMSVTSAFRVLPDDTDIDDAIVIVADPFPALLFCP